MTQKSVLPAQTQNFNQLPGPKGWPLLGSLLQLDLKKLHLIFEQWADEFGPLYKFKLANRQVIAISDLDLINEVLRKRPEYYRRLSNIDKVLKGMGVNGVFSAEGKDWKRQRRLVMQALNNDHLRNFFPTLIKVTQRLKGRWEKIVQGHQGIEVQKDFMRYTVDVTSNLAFGYDVNTIEQEGDIIQQHLEKIFPMINRRINTPIPYWHFLKLPADRALDKSLEETRKMTVEIILNCKKKLSTHPELIKRPSNFLEAMLAAQETSDSDFSEEEIFGNILTRQCALQDKEFTEAKEFQPERWLNHTKSADPGHNTNAFLPFGAGPRFCPGRNLALIEIKTVMAMLCRSFSITKAKNHKSAREHFAFTMMPADLWVNFSKRH